MQKIMLHGLQILYAEYYPKQETTEPAQQYQMGRKVITKTTKIPAGSIPNAQIIIEHNQSATPENRLGKHRFYN